MVGNINDKKAEVATRKYIPMIPCDKIMPAILPAPFPIPGEQIGEGCALAPKAALYITE